MFQNWNIFTSLSRSIISNPFAKDILTRFKSKKSGSCTRNRGGGPIPKKRGLKEKPGKWVSSGSILFLQRKLRVHPGLNAGMGKNMTIYALKPGKFMTSCEKFDPNWNWSYVEQAYGHRKGQTLYKKYMHVIAEPQHNNFKLIHLI